MRQVLAVVGPTASGKTAIAIALAKRLNTEIISADSMQLYKGLEVGTAAPTEAERRAAPHHLVSCIPPGEAMSAGRYQQIARDVVSRLNAAGKPAVAVGGSGLYISALLDGLFEGPPANAGIRQRLRAQAAAHGNDWLMAKLEAVDPAYAGTLTSENDLVRVVRALEVYELTGRPFSLLHAAHQAERQPLDAVQVAPEWDRETLYARIDARVDQMAAEGWVEEVEALLAAGHEPWLRRLKALGYKEIADYLHGRQSLAEAIEATKRHHRRYAKRQLSWFRGDARIHWLPADADTSPDALSEQALRLL